MSDTPETDEQINGKPCTSFFVCAGDTLRDALVPSEFARKLERERDEARAILKVIEQAHHAALYREGELKRERDEWIARFRADERLIKESMIPHPENPEP